MNEAFIMIPFDKLKNSKKRSAIFLLGILESNSKKLGYAYGTNKYYAKLLGCSTRTITTLLKTLVNDNCIYIEKPRSFRRKIYVRRNHLSS